VHVGVPIGTTHGVPHARQSVTVFSGVSQPLDASTSQSPKPDAHPVIAHVPPAQLVIAFARTHATLHAPQSVVVASEVSQPDASLPSQSPNPPPQLPMRQVPVAQVAAALAREHPEPQAPQLTSVVRGVSQPLPATMSQSPKPVSHELQVHVRLEQSATAWDLAHTTPQPPQSVSVSSAVSQPFDAIMSQSAKPRSHAATAHDPLRQAGVACGSAHALPHAPQLATDEPRSTSQPLPAIMSQSSNPVRHTDPHRLAVQVAIVSGGVGHAMPHAPQWVGLDARSTQLPAQSVGVGSLHPLTHA